jgi:hypothetical protein
MVDVINRYSRFRIEDMHFNVNVDVTQHSDQHRGRAQSLEVDLLKACCRHRAARPVSAYWPLKISKAAKRTSPSFHVANVQMHIKAGAIAFIRFRDDC